MQGVAPTAQLVLFGATPQAHDLQLALDELSKSSQGDLRVPDNRESLRPTEAQENVCYHVYT